MLSSVRKAYLNVDSRNPPLLRQTQRTIDISGGDQLWSDLRNLTNEERDQIDLQARVILSRCKDRVAQLEELEKRESSDSVHPLVLSAKRGTTTHAHLYDMSCTYQPLTPLRNSRPRRTRRKPTKPTHPPPPCPSPTRRLDRRVRLRRRPPLIHHLVPQP